MKCIGAKALQLFCHQQIGLRVPESLFGLKENVDFGTTFVRRLTFCTSFFFLTTGLWENIFQPYGDGKPRIYFLKNLAICSFRSKVMTAG